MESIDKAIHEMARKSSGRHESEHIGEFENPKSTVCKTILTGRTFSRLARGLTARLEPENCSQICMIAQETHSTATPALVSGSWRGVMTIMI